MNLSGFVTFILQVGYHLKESGVTNKFRNTIFVCLGICCFRQCPLFGHKKSKQDLKKDSKSFVLGASLPQSANFPSQIQVQSQICWGGHRCQFPRILPQCSKRPPTSPHTCLQMCQQSQFPAEWKNGSSPFGGCRGLSPRASFKQGKGTQMRKILKELPRMHILCW